MVHLPGWRSITSKWFVLTAKCQCRGVRVRVGVRVGVRVRVRARFTFVVCDSALPTDTNSLTRC